MTRLVGQHRIWEHLVRLVADEGVADEYVLRTIEIAARKAGMASVGVHTLRHSAAVAWLESGVHIKVVADLLGHSSFAVTCDVYGHANDTTRGQRSTCCPWPIP